MADKDVLQKGNREEERKSRHQSKRKTVKIKARENGYSRNKREGISAWMAV